ncbi:40S ribosomal protein S5-1 [Abeliophyllum distichum]|uniref:40S ribosomal protein S5-1 n=1 Tax=Abeliophyllum distichum TaxID=126358 RepID=A0ABD1TYA3_9LAMI
MATRLETTVSINDQEKVHGNVMLFNQCSYDGVEISDLSVEDNITATASKHATYISHTTRSGRREDATRIGSTGVVRRHVVDISPLRCVNQAIYLLIVGARESAFRNTKSIADELINAAKASSNIYAIKTKDEIERVAKANH